MMSQRDALMEELYQLMKKDRNIIIVNDDFGNITLDKIRLELPSQYLPIGISEETMTNVAGGIAREGKKPYCFFIAPYILRCIEQVKLQCGFANLPITFLAVGAGWSYGESGPTHAALSDVPWLLSIPNMELWNVTDSTMSKWLASYSYKANHPVYIRMDRDVHEPVYETDVDFATGFGIRGTGTDLAIVTTGVMIHEGLSLLKDLKVDGRVIDVYRLKPFNADGIREALSGIDKIVTIEEHFSGCLGNMVRDLHSTRPVKKFYVPDKYIFEYGGREALRKKAGLDHDTLLHEIRKML